VTVAGSTATGSHETTRESSQHTMRLNVDSERLKIWLRQDHVERIAAAMCRADNVLRQMERCQQLCETTSAGISGIVHRDIKIHSYDDKTIEDDDRL